MLGCFGRTIFWAIRTRESVYRSRVATLPDSVDPTVRIACSRDGRARYKTTDHGHGNDGSFFVWWKEDRNTNRVDLDLSAGYFNEKFEFKNMISYTNLRSGKLKAAHSGDITSAPNGACEYIDVDLNAAQKSGFRYIVMNVYSYTSQSFATLPECYGGWMFREEPCAGEIFDASTVAQKIDISSPTRICVPVIVDTQTEEMIWCDLGLSTQVRWSNNVENNRRSMTHLLSGMVDHQFPDLYTLFAMHAAGRGEIVPQEEDADTVFSMKRGITPFQTETISADFL